MDDSYMEASKRVMGAMPERPASADCHVVGMSLPMGVMAPRPVTTTLVMKRAYPCCKHAPVAQGIPSLPANISRNALQTHEPNHHRQPHLTVVSPLPVRERVRERASNQIPTLTPPLLARRGGRGVR